MRRIAVVTGAWAALAFTVAACQQKNEAAAPSDAQLLSQLKTNLTERERRLNSYQLEGTVQESGKTASFDFAYRAPNRMKGTVRGEGARTFSFDGDRLFVLSPGEKTLTTYEMKLPAALAAVQLTQIFGPLAPEGYRAPVLSMDHATARKVSLPNAPEAVELSSSVPDESGGSVQVTYVFRWPAMDLIEKRLTAGGQTMTLRVAEEQCDERLKLCVPKKLVQTIGDQPGATTTLTKIALNAPVPQDAFTLALPEGFSAIKHELVEAGK